MNARISILSDYFVKHDATLTQLKKMQENAKQSQKTANERTDTALLTRALVLDVANKTQVNIADRISGIVSMALSAVWDEPYKFCVDFVQRRDATEADLTFERNGYKASPLSASGGGPLDIASFALRLSLWSLQKNTRPTFILDEPFRNLSLDKQHAAGLMLKELSDKLGIQIIMVSHNPEIISGADKVFRVQNGQVVEG